MSSNEYIPLEGDKNSLFERFQFTLTKCNCGQNILVKEILQNGKNIQKN